MSKINIIVANNTVANEKTLITKVPIITRMQTGNGEYKFINSLLEVKELIETNKYSIFVNAIRGKNNDTPFQKGHRCESYKEAIEYIASNEGKYRIDLTLRNVEYNSDELAEIAASLDF